MEKEKGISRGHDRHDQGGAVKAAAERAINSSEAFGSKSARRAGPWKLGPNWKWWNRLPTSPEIHLDKARKPEVGDMVERPMDPSYLGGIAAKTAEQAIKQSCVNLRRNTFTTSSVTGRNLVTGIVRRRSETSLWRLQSALLLAERVPGELSP